MTRRTVADVYVDGVRVPAGSDDNHELAGKISNPGAWEDEPDEPKVAPKAKVAPKSKAKPDMEADSSGRPAAGDSTAVWRAYAEQLGQQVPASADGKAIAALLAEHGLLQ